jgi:hypothetical protein
MEAWIAEVEFVSEKIKKLQSGEVRLFKKYFRNRYQLRNLINQRHEG